MNELLCADRQVVGRCGGPFIKSENSDNLVLEIREHRDFPGASDDSPVHLSQFHFRPEGLRQESGVPASVMVRAPSLFDDRQIVRNGEGFDGFHIGWVGPVRLNQVFM